MRKYVAKASIHEKRVATLTNDIRYGTSAVLERETKRGRNCMEKRYRNAVRCSLRTVLYEFEHTITDLECGSISIAVCIQNIENKKTVQ